MAKRARPDPEQGKVVRGVVKRARQPPEDGGAVRGNTMSKRVRSYPGDMREQFVLRACSQLAEKNIDKLRVFTSELGRSVVEGLVRKTLDLERNGGQLTGDGSKRRAPGGVFFELCRKELGSSAYSRVCTAFRKSQRARSGHGSRGRGRPG